MSIDEEDKLTVENVEKDPPVTEDQEDSTHRSGGGPFALVLPPDAYVWKEARKLAADKSIRVEDLATCCAQDPILVMDLIKVANAMYFSAGRSPITTVRTSIVRLGSDVVIDTLEKMTGRISFEDEPDIHHWFEYHRNRCRRTSIIVRILSEAIARTLSDDCQVSSLLLYFGEMLAVGYLKTQYVSLAKDLPRSGLNYRLAQDHRFDVEAMGISYLRRYGIPEPVLFAIDRGARPRTPDRAIMKPLCFASGEIVDAFDSNRWEKLAPGKSLPVKSSLRMLQMTDNQYLKVYERCSEYLFSIRLLEEKKKQIHTEGIPENTSQTNVLLDTEASLHSEIELLLRSGGEEAEQETELIEASTKDIPKASVQATEVPKAQKIVAEQFSLDSKARSKPKEARQKEKAATPKPPPPPPTFTSKSKQVIDSMSNLCEAAKTSEELISEILQMLVDNGPFEKTALIVVSKDRKKAVVVAARGSGIGNGQTLVLEDPLSPLAQCFSKIQSFGTKGSAHSPFGSKTFALSPIDADHDTPVALYADCGDKGGVSFEARRIFRNVVEILNQKLPQIPGGIPVEI